MGIFFSWRGEVIFFVEESFNSVALPQLQLRARRNTYIHNDLSPLYETPPRRSAIKYPSSNPTSTPEHTPKKVNYPLLTHQPPIQPLTNPQTNPHHRSFSLLTPSHRPIFPSSASSSTTLSSPHPPSSPQSLPSPSSSLFLSFPQEIQRELAPYHPSYA